MTNSTNNNMIFNDAFTFNNVNTSSFIFGHNKSENGINLGENCNMDVNNDKLNDNEEIIMTWTRYNEFVQVLYSSKSKFSIKNCF